MSKNDFYLELKREESDVLETLKALQVLIKRYETENPVEQKKEVLNPGAFDELQGILRDATKDFNLMGLSIPKKILSVLRLLGKGTSRQVAEKLFELDKSKPMKEWLDECRYYLSLYYNEKNPEKRKVIVIKDDTVRGNVYTLPV